MNLLKIKQWIKEPLLHFTLIGSALFGLYYLVNPDAGESSDTIIVSQNRISLLKTQFERTWNRPPSGEELSSLIDNFIIEEIFYRQALAMELDVNDAVIRRRLRQKMEWWMTDNRDVLTPDDQELVAYLREHASAFETPAKFSFDQVSISLEDSPQSLNHHILKVQQQLSAGIEVQGSLSMMPRRFDLAMDFQVDRYFGEGFAKQIAALPLNQWSGPLQSGMGIHFVWLREYKPPMLPDLADVRAQVIREWRNDKSAQSEIDMLEHLKSTYTIVIESESDQRI